MEAAEAAPALVRQGQDAGEGTVLVQGIKLFGQTIPLPPPRPTFKEEEEYEEDERSFNQTTRSTSSVTTTTTTATMTTSAAEHKRPDKIVPCPRCKSMDTKFCYFNNYNVNQPRHFCKGCQRYWTAGGALRNVPIGAGRRKVKPGLPVAGGSVGQVFVGGFPSETSGCEGFDFDRAVLEEYYWANHHHQQQRLVMATARSGGFCEDFPDTKRRKNESAPTTTPADQPINC